MVPPMQVNAGSAANFSQLRCRIWGMLANSSTFASAGTPGGYDLSQGLSTVFLSSTIVAMGRVLFAGSVECTKVPRRTIGFGLALNWRAQPSTGGTHGPKRQDRRQQQSR